MSQKLSPVVTLNREQKEQRRPATAQELLETNKTQAQIAEDHGATSPVVSYLKSTLEEEGIDALESNTDEGNQPLTRTLTSKVESNSSSCLKKEHKLMAGRLISGLPSKLLH